MNTEQERTEFEAWYRLHHGSRDVYGRDASGEYADKQVQDAFNVWQVRAALAAQDEALLRAENARMRAEIDALAAVLVGEWKRVVAARGEAEARAEQLAEALKKVAQSLDWYAHGRCRGFDDEAPLPTNEAVALAERTLAKALGHDDPAMAA